MSDKEDVKKAALRALAGGQDKLDKADKKKTATSLKIKTPPKLQKTKNRLKKARKKTAASAAAQTPKSKTEDNKTGDEKSKSTDDAPEKEVLKAADQKEKSKTAKPAHKASGNTTSHAAPPPETTKKDSGEIGGRGFLALALLIPLGFVVWPYVQTYFYKDENAQTSQASSASTAAISTQKASGSTQKTNGKTIANAQKPKHTPIPAVSSVVGSKGTPETATKSLAATKTDHAKAQTHETSWSYKNTDWALLDPAFKTCGNGKSQSPINIPASTGNPGPNFAFNYFPQSGKVHHNGHTIQVDLDTKTERGSQLRVNGSPYDLIQFHFHTPSENHLNGKSYPMEAHLVHKNAQNQLAVVAIMITGGGFNQLLDKMPLPMKQGDSHKSSQPNINPFILLPSIRNYLTFEGSLTTPPCTQKVGWIVMQQPLQVSDQTLAKFQRILGKNNRPLQALNGRTIYTNY